jgi:hypothetical protein
MSPGSNGKMMGKIWKNWNISDDLMVKTCRNQRICCDTMMGQIGCFTGKSSRFDGKDEKNWTI